MDLEKAIERINELEKTLTETQLKVTEHETTIDNYKGKLSETEQHLKTSREVSVKLSQENSTLRFNPSQPQQPNKQQTPQPKITPFAEMLEKL